MPRIPRCEHPTFCLVTDDGIEAKTFLNIKICYGNYVALDQQSETISYLVLNCQARSLAAQQAETEITRFMIGTQSLGQMSDNQIHVVELNDETGALYTQVNSIL